LEEVGMNLYSYDEFTDNEVAQKISFVKQTSATGLAAIGDKKKNEGDDYIPTDEECAVLFTATDLSSEHPIVMSSMFMAFVRSPHYDDNMKVLIDEKGKLGDETEISAQQYYDIYSQLEIDDVFEVVLSTELFGFIKDTDLANLTTNSDGNQVLIVPLGDIAVVTPTEEYSSYAYYYDGQMNVVNGLVINVYKSNGANSSSVVKQVKSVYSEMEEGENFEVTVSLLDDQSEFISDSISNVLVSMLIGGALAIIIIFIFLKQVKQSLIIAVTMPLSVLAALICMYAMGITLNMVSLGGLAVGIGMLVDNSIVVIESISKHRDMGKTAYQAAVDGSCEVGGALIGSTLTTVCVFIPIIFSGGLTGEIFTDLSWAVIFSLTFSLIIAVTVIPTLYSMLNGGDRQMLRANTPASQLEEGNATDKKGLEESSAEVKTLEESTEKSVEAETGKGGKKHKGLAKLKEPLIMRSIDKIYRKVLPKVLSKRVITVVAAVVIFGTSVFMVTLTGTEFLPSIDKGQIEVDMSYGANAQIEDVEKDVLAFTNTIKDNIDNIDYMSASVGKNGLLALTNTGIITVQLTTSRHTDKVVQQIRELVATSGTVGTVTVSEVDGVIASLMSGSSGVSVSIMGDDNQKLTAIANEIRGKLTEDSSLGFTDVKDTLTEQSTQYRLDFDEYKLAEYGLDYTTVITTLRVGIASYTAATVEIEGDSYDLNVQFADDVFAADESQTPREKLANFIIGYDGTDAIHLSDVLNKENEGDDGIIEEKTDACIRRSNGYNTVVITAQNTVLDSGEAGRQMKAIAKEVLSKEEYQDYTFESSGVSSYLTDAFSGLAVALVISFFLLYAVMAIQFSSFIKPLIVMASIPFSFTGGFIALLITGTSLNVVSFIGLIMLMGVIVNNAIVMLEKIKQLHDDGMPHYQAVQEACYARLRPILMTTLTTILALVPMAIGVGKGSELMQPLGIVVMGGLLVGTLVTLALVPAVYCLFNRISQKYPDGKKKK
jgi:HAE1 family hydrophobic/amphiphilic exporter-1